MDEFRGNVTVRIRWDERGWYLNDARTERLLFSFDLPPELFLRYAETGNLSPERALELKEDFFSKFTATVTTPDGVRHVTFLLDIPWMQEMQAQLRRLARGKDRRRRDQEG